MSDLLQVSAPVRDATGNEYVASMTIPERDSEVISDDDIAITFLFACHRNKVTCVGKIESKYL